MSFTFADTLILLFSMLPYIHYFDATAFFFRQRLLFHIPLLFYYYAIRPFLICLPPLFSLRDFILLFPDYVYFRVYYYIAVPFFHFDLPPDIIHFHAIYRHA